MSTAKQIGSQLDNFMSGRGEVDSIIKSIDHQLEKAGGKKFNQIFGGVNFEHTLAKRFGQDYRYLPRNYLLKGQFTTQKFNLIKRDEFDKPLMEMMKKYTKNPTDAMATKIKRHINKFNDATNNYADFTFDSKKGKLVYPKDQKVIYDLSRYADPGQATKELVESIRLGQTKEFQKAYAKNPLTQSLSKKSVQSFTESTEGLKLKKQARQFIIDIGCPGKAAGGRVGFQDGTTCYTKGMDKIKTGNITTAAEKLNFNKLAQTLGPDGWRFLGIDYDDPGRIARLTSAMSKGVERLPTPGRVPLQLTGKLATGVGRFLADPFFIPLIPLEMMVTSAYQFEKNKDNIMKSLKENPMVTEMAKKYNMSAADVRNAILEKYRRAVLNTEGGLEEQMAFEPKHDEVVETFDKEFYPFWDPNYQAVGPKKTDTSFVKDPAFGEITGRTLLGTWQEREEEEHKLRSGEVGGTQFYKKPTYYTKKEFYPKDHPDKTLAEQLKSEKRIRFENLRGLEDPLPEGGFYEGGRVPFVKGKLVDEGRRKFMQWLAGITGATIAAGTGLIKWGVKKGTGKTIIKAGDHIIQGTPGMPDWFIPLINRIVKEGDNVTKKLGTVEREIVHTKKISKTEEVTVYNNLDTGNVRVEYGPTHPRASNDLSTVHLEYRAPEVIDEGKYAGKKTKSEFEAVESEPKYVATGPDDAEVVWDLDNVVGNVDDLTTDTSKLKKFATKKKLTHRDKVKAKKKQKSREILETDTETQVDYSASKYGEGPDPDYDDYLPDIDDLD
jgi:hypothetical protein